MQKGPLLPGIYTITNTLTGRVYVGQTARTFKIRWENHHSALNLGKHTAKRLVRSWARDGADAFIFAVQEVVPRPAGMSATWRGSMKGTKSSDGTRAKLRAAWQRRRKVDGQASLPGL